jgi:hypothetical protein
MTEHDDDTCPHLVRASLLEAENARLKAELDYVRKMRTQETLDLQEMSDLNNAFRAEVERLRKAGDAMADIDSCFDGNTPITQGVGSVFKIVKRWKDANKI